MCVVLLNPTSQALKPTLEIQPREALAHPFAQAHSVTHSTRSMRACARVHSHQSRTLSHILNTISYILTHVTHSKHNLIHSNTFSLITRCWLIRAIIHSMSATSMFRKVPREPSPRSLSLPPSFSLCVSFARLLGNHLQGLSAPVSLSACGVWSLSLSSLSLSLSLSLSALMCVRVC